jgi:hypothetical protein
MVVRDQCPLPLAVEERRLVEVFLDDIQHDRRRVATHVS